MRLFQYTIYRKKIGRPGPRPGPARPHLDNLARLRVTGPVQPATFRRFVNGGFFMLPTSLTEFEYQTRHLSNSRPFDDGRRFPLGQTGLGTGQPLLWALSAVALAACGQSGGGPAGLPPVPQSLRPAGEGTDFLYTGPADPLRQGKADGRGGADQLAFVAYDSVLAGGSGDDVIILRGAENRVLGEAGDDVLIAVSGRHDLQGGAGNDALYGGLDSDKMTGGAGADRFFLSPHHDGLVEQITDFERGLDHLFIQLPVQYGITQEVHSDGLHFIWAGLSQLVLDGLDRPIAYNRLYGDGTDSAQASSGADWLIGGAGADMLIGGAGHDRLEGKGGDDSLSGGTGNDLLSGGAGNDVIEGGDGSDRLDGGAGRDSLTGGLGGDVFVLAVAGSTMLTADVITDFGFSAQDRPPMPDALEFADNTKTVWIRGNTHAATGRRRDDGNDPSPDEGTDTVLYADAAASLILGVLEDWDMGATELASHLTDSSIQLVEIV